MATGACFACDDNIDNDGDGFVDYPADPGCRNASSTTESPECNDRIDNDGDGKIDFDGGASATQGAVSGTPDPQCTVAWHGSEAPVWCGLGFELALVIPVLEIARRHRRRRRP
jgi:hypothetical protein